MIAALVVPVLFGSYEPPDTARALGKFTRILKSDTRTMKEDAPERPPAATPATAITS
ncbi:twin-arginine translocase TatA/TatE family subunit [Streptomyces sp. NPDC005426]|uniref:twin-arginine translocase TatA/TatE family subunit n=1 Tax=Streptomyces sp. NPDC005426 TaxID=3155344 RepID=UPI0033ABDF89